jgi:hypothetical protein
MTTGVAIAMILDWIGWTDSALRQLDTGDVIPGFEATGDKTALGLIQELLAPNLGVFYIDAVGRAVYENRNTMLTRGLKAALVNTMRAIGTGVTLDQVKTKWTVTRQFRTGPGNYSDSTPQVTENTLASNEFGQRSDELSSRYITTDSLALQLSQRLVDLTVVPVGPLWELTIDNRTPELMEAILTLGIHDRVQAIEAQTQTQGIFFIEQVAGTLDGHRLSMRYLLTDREANTLIFVVGVNEVGSSYVLGF